MFDMIFRDPVSFLLLASGRIPAILFALSFHEAAHAWMALRCGDDTAARMGRITLNPLSHLDPIGSIGLIFGFFGWGRPVPYVERNLRDPRRDGMLIAAAGPASNVILAAGFGLAFRLLQMVEGGMGPGTGRRMVLFLIFLCAWSILINLCLCFFNLIPVFPLDGEKILVGLLPYRQAYGYASLRQYGPMMLLLLILVGSDFVGAWVDVMSTPFFYLFAGTNFGGILNVIGRTFSELWG